MAAAKLRFDEIPPRALQEVARAATVGAEKHSADPAVEKPISVQFAALMRHAIAFYAGEDRGPGDEHSHLAAVSLRAMQLMETVRTRADLDDRPKT
jgi:hypothetical protein